jgi:hypothetical protein
MLFDILENMPERFTWLDYIKLIPAAPILVIFVAGMAIVLIADTLMAVLYKND